MHSTSSGFLCPVCGYPDLEEAAYSPQGLASFEICPCCRTEFGYQDFARTHAELRIDWLARGAKWESKSHPPPDGWDPYEQLRSAGFAGRLAGSGKTPF